MNENVFQIREALRPDEVRGVLIALVAIEVALVSGSEGDTA